MRRVSVRLLLVSNVSLLWRFLSIGCSVMSYSNQEYFNMLMCLGKANCNYAAARRDYEVRFHRPGVPVPSERAFQRLHNRVFTTGSAHGHETQRADAGRPRERNLEIEDQVLDMFAADATQSTRSVARQLETNHMLVWRVLKGDGQHPYHYRRVQSLLPADYEPRMEFCNWILRKVEEHEGFLNRVLFSDECSFVRTGVFNCHNEHVWALENPLAMKPSNFQHRWRVNVWAGILGDQIIGPYFLRPTMNGSNYLSFLSEELSEELDPLIDLNFHRSMWFQHDGAPPHFSRAVREYLDAQFPRQWIGRGGPVSWPARSPDLTPLDFYLWGHVKQMVFKKECDSEIEVRARIVAAFNLIKSDTSALQRVRENLIKRCRMCISVGGRHVEHDRRGIQQQQVTVLIN